MKKQSKEELSREVKRLRRLVEKSEAESLLRSETNGAQKRQGHLLRERVKELGCLFGVAEIIERHGTSMENILQDTAELLPRSWQYPEITCARIIAEGKEYLSGEFRTSPWKQTADIRVSGTAIGAVEVYYSKKKPAMDEGPFLKEERLLIGAVGDRIGRVCERLRAEHLLQERVKELGCLFGVAEIIERHGTSMENILQDITELLPRSWQYPEITCARIVAEGKEYLSRGFRTSRWKQTADIMVTGKIIGAVEVCYSKKRPAMDEGPFLKEERLLIGAVGDRIGRAFERNRVEQQLDVERTSLHNMNVALREVLSKVQDEKKEIAERTQANVDRIIVPILHALESEVEVEQQGYIRLLKQNLEEIVSPFADKLTREFSALTPAEIQICNMIRKGLSSKEIARLRHISPATVNGHREHIRNKLGIKNKEVNLATYLNNSMPG